MADTLQTLALIQLATKFAPEIVEQVQRNTVLVNLLDKRLGINAGGPNWVAESSGALAEVAAEGADASNFGSDAQAQALLAWGNYRGNFHVSDEAASRAIIAGNPAGNVALWARNMLNAVDVTAKKLEVDSFASGATNAVTGLGAALDDSNTYAGIDRSQAGNSYFRAYKVAPGTLTTLSTALVRTDLANIMNAGGQRPDIAVCNPLVFTKVLEAFGAQREFFTPSTMAPGSTFLGDVKLPYASIDGCKFVEAIDGYAANNNGYIYYLNSRHAFFEYVPYVDVEGFGGFAPMTSGNQVSELPFAMQFVPLAKAGSSSKAMVRFQCQLVIDRPNRCGIRKDINTA